MLGSKMSQFVFDAGARYYNVKMTWAEFRESESIYQQLTLTAFQEVEDALSNLMWLAREMESAENSVTAAKKAYTIAFDRYLEGVDFYLQVADDERQLLDNQRIYIELLGLRYLNTIQLIKALGGGWQ
jgi:multidrug efflux system outer membrane protein